MATRQITVVAALALIAGPAFAGDAQTKEDAWTKIENKQLAYALAELMDDKIYKELRSAAQERYGFDEAAGEHFMTCVTGLAAHPDYTTGKVKEAMGICAETTKARRNRG